MLLTVFTGLVGLLLRRNLFLKLMGIDGMGTGVISFLVLVAARSGFRTPFSAVVWCFPAVATEDYGCPPVPWRPGNRVIRS
ncbi:NADH-quinone oxidoreductase subunit K [Cyanobium sp. La Preciosa 7G6]|nr:NADH-quinone oxidoreductase subunit K [Cyanobium sp. La Preciosa 7G6]